MKCIKYDSILGQILCIISIFAFVLFTLVIYCFTEKIVLSTIFALFFSAVLIFISAYFKRWKIEFNDVQLIQYIIFNKPKKILFSEITEFKTIQEKRNTIVYEYLIISSENDSIKINKSIKNVQQLEKHLNNFKKKENQYARTISRQNPPENS